MARLQAVSLALAALSFDFVGTCLDESSEDLGTIQARLPWAAPHCVGRLPGRDSLQQSILPQESKR